MVTNKTPKISIIVPVYNEEKNIKKCLNSILLQPGNFEVIVVNDGSNDNSEKIIKEIKDNRLKYFYKKNSGLSDTRNFGIRQAKGDYLMFVDGDDWIENDSMKVLLKSTEENYDLIKFDYNIIKGTQIIPKISVVEESVKSGEYLLVNLINNKIVFEMSTLYLYNKKNWNKNNYCFAHKRFHEDFGLIPKIILESKTIKYLEKIVYNYNNNSEGIIRTVDTKKEIKRANDCFELGVEMLKYFKKYKFKTEENKKIIESFIANAIIGAGNLIGKKENRVQYIKKIVNYDITSFLLENSFKHKIKKGYIKIKHNLIVGGKS